jgi:protein-tyrosine phosphatase
LCGKHAIGPDPARLLDAVQASFVVCLTERHELADRYPVYVAWLDQHAPARAAWFPVPDLCAPSLDRFADIVGTIADRLATGETVVVHCAAGIGRAGTVAAGVLMQIELPHDDALAHVAAHRPMAGPEAGAQQHLLRDWADELARLRTVGLGPA